MDARTLASVADYAALLAHRAAMMTPEQAQATLNSLILPGPPPPHLVGDPMDELTGAFDRAYRLALQARARGE